MKWFLIIWVMNSGTFTEIGPFGDRVQCGLSGLEIRELHESNSIKFICIEHDVQGEK